MFKSSLSVDGNNVLRSLQLVEEFGFKQGSLPVQYLGLPLAPHKLRPHDYRTLVYKVVS